MLSARDERASGDCLLKVLPITSRETKAQKRWEHGQSDKGKARAITCFQSLDIGLASEPGLTAPFPSLSLPLWILSFSKLGATLPSRILLQFRGLRDPPAL